MKLALFFFVASIFIVSSSMANEFSEDIKYFGERGSPFTGEEQVPLHPDLKEKIKRTLEQCLGVSFYLGITGSRNGFPPQNYCPERIHIVRNGSLSHSGWILIDSEKYQIINWDSFISTGISHDDIALYDKDGKLVALRTRIPGNGNNILEDLVSITDADIPLSAE